MNEECVYGDFSISKDTKVKNSECYPLKKDIIAPQSTFFLALLVHHRTGTSPFSTTYINERVRKFNPLRNFISSET